MNNVWHPHPRNAGERVFGRALEPGEVTQEGDVYDSTGEKWEPLPMTGIVVHEDHAALLIRPVEECRPVPPAIRHQQPVTVIETDPDTDRPFSRAYCAACQRNISDVPI